MSEEQTVVQTITKYGERLKWVVLVGGFLVTILCAGFGYQVTVNLGHSEVIQTNQAALKIHMESVDPIHQSLIEKWVNDQ